MKDTVCGADVGIRTRDLILTKNVLCLLSYIGLLARPGPIGGWSATGQREKRRVSPPPAPVKHILPQLERLFEWTAMIVLFS